MTNGSRPDLHVGGGPAGLMNSPLFPRIQRRIFFGVPLPPLDYDTTRALASRTRGDSASRQTTKRTLAVMMRL